jgi:predicted alpha/beta hydrolase
MSISISQKSLESLNVRVKSLNRAENSINIVSRGATLTGQLYLPDGLPRAVVVFHGAVGVPKRRYSSFAAWLAAERGLACLTYDYRHFGASSAGTLRNSKATLSDWGMLDQEAALNAAEHHLPGVPLWVIGHSLGGAMLPFHRPRNIERAIIIAAGLLHVSDHPWPYQALARQFWYLTGPAATLTAGFLPGKIIGFGSDLPAGVFWQWRRWCTTRGFHLNDAGTKLPQPDPMAHTAPTRLIAISDDVMVPPPAVWRLMELIPQAVKRQRVLRPQDFGLQRIGHLGAFNRENAVLWPTIVD